MYSRIIEQFVATPKAAYAMHAAATAFERDSVVAFSRPLPVGRLLSGYRKVRELEAFCRSVAGGVLKRAGGEFAPSDVRLDVAYEDGYRRAGLGCRRSPEGQEDPDTDGLWASMARRYGEQGNATLVNPPLSIQLESHRNPTTAPHWVTAWRQWE